MKMKVRLLALLLCVWRAAGEIVETEHGPVQGQTLKIHLNNGDFEVTSFYGLPYGRAPIDDLRFEPPQKHQGYDGLFDASRLPDLCMQNPLGVLVLTHPQWFRYSEDCLTLTVFKPKTVQGLLPVLVWFHGGGYNGGGSIQYPGHFMAAHGVVIVVVNYRMGIFGFASTPDKQIRGNMGMLDQLLALRWVQDNIENFGGDKTMVTIYGQSAGASSAALHLLSPRAKGLFSQAIYESGAEYNIWSINVPASDPENYMYQVAERLECPTDDDTKMVECMRAIPARTLRQNDWLECTPGYFCQGFAPIVDGPGGYLPDHPYQLRKELEEDSIPIINGICSDDGSLYAYYFVPEMADGGFNRTMFQYLLRERFVSLFEAIARTEEILENSYQAVDWKYTPWPYIEDNESNRDAFSRLVTDAAFGYAWDRSSKFNSKHAPTYNYIMGYRDPETTFPPQWMGVPHNGELAYVWGYGYLQFNPDVRRESGILIDVIDMTPDDAIYSDYVFTLWSNFAKFGNPTPEPGVPGPFNKTLTHWPKFTEEDNYKTLWFGKDIEIKEQFRQRDYWFFTDYLAYVTEQPIVKSKKPKSSRKGFNTKRIHEVHEKFAKEIIRKHFPDEAEEIIQKLQNL